MGMLDLLLGRKAAPGARGRHSRPAPTTQFDSQHTQTGGSTQSVRKDLLKLAMRETLTRNGIPPTWLAVDLLRTTTAKKEAGLHVRFLVRHWEPRLLQHGVALEKEFTHRLLLLDPLAHSWLMGFSWQFALDDTSPCPGLPHPKSWTTPAAREPAPQPTEPAPIASADVIEGPPPIEVRSQDDVRADLERLLALRDDDLRRHGAREQAYAPTRPAML